MINLRWRTKELDKTIIALLPMKGNSERVPEKNLKNFAGKPLFHSILSTLLSSKYISKVIINTDSEKIAQNAVDNFQRVEIHWRPEEICGDMVSMNKIIENDLNQLDSECFIQTHSTNPLISVETIDNAIKTFFEMPEPYDSLFSVTRLQTRLYWKDGEPINHNPDELLRTQDLQPVFEENSNFFIFSKKSFLNAGNTRIGNCPKMHEVNKTEASDIDDPEDFEIAEAIFIKRNQT